MFDNLLFDLDGTLTDSYDGIINAVLYALKKMDAPLLERNEMGKFVGPPLTYSFINFCGFSKEKADAATELYREYYSERGWKENKVYDGVPEMLAALKAKGKLLAVATSKPEFFARKICEHFGIAKYFDFIGGASFDHTRADKELVIEYVINTLDLNRSRTLMIGDRKYDVIGGKTTGLKTMGVLYGYGDRAEHEAAGADYIADTPQAVVDMIE